MPARSVLLSLIKTNRKKKNYTTDFNGETSSPSPPPHRRRGSGSGRAPPQQHRRGRRRLQLDSGEHTVDLPRIDRGVHGGGQRRVRDGLREQPAHISHQQVHQLRCAAGEQRAVLAARRVVLQLPARRRSQSLHTIMLRRHTVPELVPPLFLFLYLFLRLAFFFFPFLFYIYVYKRVQIDVIIDSSGFE